MKTNEEIVELLNEMLAVDPHGMAKIFMHRIPVSNFHTPHPRVVTAPIGGVEQYGALGIINALLDETIVMMCRADDPFLIPIKFCTETQLNEFQAAAQQCCRDNPKGNACGADCPAGEPQHVWSDDRPG
jgi:hypothetical protein